MEKCGTCGVMITVLVCRCGRPCCDTCTDMCVCQNTQTHTQPQSMMQGLHAYAMSIANMPDRRPADGR